MKHFAAFSASNCVLKIQEMNYDNNNNKNSNILSLYWNNKNDEIIQTIMQQKREKDLQEKKTIIITSTASVNHNKYSNKHIVNANFLQVIHIQWFIIIKVKRKKGNTNSD